MNLAMYQSRRAILSALGGLAALALVPRDLTGGLLTLDPLESLLARIRGNPGSATIAAAWKADDARVLDVGVLRADLVRDIGATGNRLRERIVHDFVQGRTLLVDGWPVAETEARLCVLAQAAENGIT